jgi:hypothetical protein
MASQSDLPIWPPPDIANDLTPRRSLRSSMMMSAGTTLGDVAWLFTNLG